jgi:hypothetical protein
MLIHNLDLYGNYLLLKAHTKCWSIQKRAAEGRALNHLEIEITDLITKSTSAALSWMKRLPSEYWSRKGKIFSGG